MTNRRRINEATVVRTEHLTPHLIRVVLGGAGLAGFATTGHTDDYIKLLFPAPGVTYPEPFDLDTIRRELPHHEWPRVRTYTVRGWDLAAGELTIDFVYHGDEGVAGPWAAHASPGDVLRLLGPSGAYRPRAEADWHLFAGDESCLPAIGASLEVLAPGATARVFVEVAGPDEELKLSSYGHVDITWVHRGDQPVGQALVEAVRGFEFPAGTVHAFVHGEAFLVKQLRHLLRVERGVDREQLSISGYWRRGADEDGWRAVKAEWNAQVEADEVAATQSASSGHR